MRQHRFAIIELKDRPFDDVETDQRWRSGNSASFFQVNILSEHRAGTSSGVPRDHEFNERMQNLKRWLQLCFTFERRVTRSDYLRAGVLLALIKFAGDTLMVFAATGKFWAPTDYFSPVHALVSTRLADAPLPLLPMLAIWALPFVWVGITMSMRRALDAGAPAWWALCFFVPGISYLFIFAMCVMPTDTSNTLPIDEPRAYEPRLPGALMSMAVGIGIGLGMLTLSVFALKLYGASLFIGTPFVIGAVTAFLFNRRYPATFRETLQVVAMTIFCIAGITMLVAAEGALCLAMAAPLAVALAAMGAALGRKISLHDHRLTTGTMLAVLTLPMSAVIDANRALPTTNVREIRSSIEIAASAEAVWKQVIAFPALPEPTDLVFRIGIAYPKHAEIRGTGVGAVRYCVFSTGAFVEPITRWEHARRLSFDVTASPPPLSEWSPFANVTPPHLDGYFASRRGEFRLIPLPNGHTRLEGSTWYEMKLYPEGYWSLFGDPLISKIHGRVLEHIKQVSEESAQALSSRMDIRSQRTLSGY